jgi:hypothetical protein
MEKRKSQQGVGLRIGHVWVSSGWTWCASIGWQCLEAAGECTYMSPWRAVRLRWWGEKWILALYSRNSAQCNSQWQQQRAATAVGWNSPPIVSYGKPFPVVWGWGLPDKPTVAISRCWGKDGWPWLAQSVYRFIFILQTKMLNKAKRTCIMCLLFLDLCAYCKVGIIITISNLKKWVQVGTTYKCWYLNPKSIYLSPTLLPVYQ